MSEKTLVRSSIYFSFISALIILLLRYITWIKTDSLSVLSIFLDSALDIASSMINLLAVRFLYMPPDNKHRFGHEKIQDLVVFAQSIFFSALGIILLYQIITNMINKHVTVRNIDFGINITIISLVLNLILVAYQTYVYNLTNSTIVKADKAHYTSDILASIGLIFSIYYSDKFYYLDSIFSAIVTIYIFYNAYILYKDSIKNLIDEEMDQSQKDKIIKITLSHPDVKGMHQLKTRSSGNKKFIQFDIELEGDLTLNKTHDISYQISQRIKEEIANSEVFIHKDPYKANKKHLYSETISRK